MTSRVWRSRSLNSWTHVFHCFNNGFPNCCIDFVPFVFADETTCSCSRDNIGLNLGSALQKTSEWISSNQLSLNTEKNKLLQFMILYDSDTKLGECVRSESECVMCPGLYLDKYLSFHEHIGYVKNKLSQCVSVTLRLKSFLPRGVRKKY